MIFSSIVANLIFSIGGFILGFVVARIGQRVEEVSEAIVDGDSLNPKVRKSRFTAKQIFGVIILVLALGSTVVSAIATSEQRRSAANLQRIADCQAGFNKAYRLALIERMEAANEERRSTREMWGALLDPSATPETRREAATRYYKTLDEGDRKRAQNPLPASDRCE